MDGRGLGQGDDPGLGVPRLVDHGDIGRDPFPGQLDTAEQVLAAREARGQRGLSATILEDPVGNGLSLGTRVNASEPLRANTTFGQSFSTYGRSLQGGAGVSFNSFYNAGGPRSFQFSLKLEF